MNVAGVLGAPSLPKFTPVHDRSSADEKSSASPALAKRTPVDSPPAPRRAAVAELPASRPTATSGVARRDSSPVPVAEKSATATAVVGRRPAALPRIVEAAVHLRPNQITRLRLSLEPERLGELVIDLVLRGGALQGTIRVENEAARDR